MPFFRDDLYSGHEVAEYIKEITPYKPDIPYSWLEKYVKPNNFQLKVLNISEDIITMEKIDTDFLEYYNNTDTPRYEYSEEDGFYIDEFGSPAPDVSHETLGMPIVIVNGRVIDGYARLKAHIDSNAETIEAFVKID